MPASDISEEIARLEKRIDLAAEQRDFKEADRLQERVYELTAAELEMEAEQEADSDELNEEDFALLASWLLSKRETGASVDASEMPPLPNVAAAYSIHRSMCAISSSLGDHIGYKVGKLADLPDPFRAPLFSRRIGMSKAEVDVSSASSVEAHFMFTMAASLPPKPHAYSAAEVWGAVQAVSVAFEVCGSRVSGDASALQLLADGGCNVTCIVGDTTHNAGDLEQVGVSISVNQSEVASVKAAPAPIASLTWLANELISGAVSTMHSAYGGGSTPAGLHKGER
jgi:2-keto-4-pentenoate hydratase